MKFNASRFRRITTRALVLVLVLSFIIPPSTAQAWKSNAHVYLAELARLDALDGTITLPRYDPDTGLETGEPLGPYPVDPRILLALQNCPAQYRAGALGPDAYPDVLTGQLLTHPDNQPDGQAAFTMATNSSQWINRLWNALPLNSLPATSATCSEGLAKLAFATGYLTHSAGDMYGHTFINNFAGGAFDLTDNALQHVIIEGYVDRLIPVDETPDFFTIDIQGAKSLIYDILVKAMPGRTTASHVADDKANFLSLPRFFDSLRMLPAGIITAFNEQIDSYNESIDYYLLAADNCDWDDTSCSAVWLSGRAAYYQGLKTTFQGATAAPRAYLNAWIEDIDNGLMDWVDFNHEVALAKLFKPEGGRPDDFLFPEKVADFITLSLEPMSPLPDGIGVVLRLLIPLGYPDFVDQIIRWGNNFYDYLLDYDLYGGITVRKIQDFPYSSGSLFDIVVLVGDGPKIYRQQFRREVLHMQTQTGLEAVDSIRNDATVLDLVQRAQHATGIERTRLVVQALDRASALEKLLTPEVLDRLYLETLDYHLIPAMRNTLAMDKLILLSREGMDQLLQDISYRCTANLVPTPIMLGTFMRSLDKSDQGLDPTVPLDRPTMGLGPLAPDSRPLMGIARDPVAYRTVLQLQEGHSPTVLGYLSQNGTQCPGDAAYLACTDRSMTLAASYNPPGGTAVTDMAFAGSLLYLTAGTDGLYILDTAGLLSGGNALLSHLALREGFNAQNVLVDGSTAFISNGQAGLISVDIADPAAPAVIADFTRMQPGVFNSYATDTYGLAKSGNRLFVSAGYNGVLMIDTSSQELQEIEALIPPKRLIQNPLEDQFNVLDVDLLDANTLLVTTYRYLMVFDVSPAAYSPILLAYTALPENAYRTTLGSGQAHSLAYVADGRGGLQVYNLAGARAGAGITYEGGLDLMGLSTDVAVKDDSTAITAATSTLYTIDTTHFTLMKPACPVFEQASRVVIEGGHLYLGEEGVLKVFSVP